MAGCMTASGSGAVWGFLVECLTALGLEGAEKVSLWMNGEKPGAEAPFRALIFVGLKPYASSQKQRQRLFSILFGPLKRLRRLRARRRGVRLCIFQTLALPGFVSVDVVVTG